MSDPVRGAAAALVAGVLDRGQSLAEQIGAAAGPIAGLDAPGRARAQGLATNTLRHLGRIDAVLDVYMEKPPPSIARNALRLAVAEMYLDGVPAHAAVHSAVELTRGTSGRGIWRGS